MNEKKLNIIIKINPEFCSHNHFCPVVKMCPKKAISHNDKKELPVINFDLCDDCGECYALCRAFEKVL